MFFLEYLRGYEKKIILDLKSEPKLELIQEKTKTINLVLLFLNENQVLGKSYNEKEEKEKEGKCRAGRRGTKKENVMNQDKHEQVRRNTHKVFLAVKSIGCELEHGNFQIGTGETRKLLRISTSEMVATAILPV